MIYLKASLLVGVVLASPWVFYQIWQFVAAGLYPHERRYVHIFLPMSLVLFLAGAAMAYFLAFDKVLALPAELQQHDGHRPRSAHQRVDELRACCCRWRSASASSFPLVMLFLERIGLLTVKTYLASWRMAVLAIFVLAMILTPSARSVYDVPDGLPAHAALFRRRAAVQDISARQKPSRCTGGVEERESVEESQTGDPA